MTRVLSIIVTLFLVGCKNEPETSLVEKKRTDSLRIADSVQGSKSKSMDKMDLKDTLIAFDQINDSLIISKVFAKSMQYDKKLGWLFKPGAEGKDTLFADIEGQKYITEIDTIYLVIISSPPIYDNCNYLVQTYQASLKFEKNKWVLVQAHEDLDVQKNTIETFVKGPYIIRKSEFAGSHCFGRYSSGVTYQITYRGRNTESGFYYEIASDNEASVQSIDLEGPNSECHWGQTRGYSENLEYDKKRKALVFNSSSIYIKHFGHTCSDSTLKKTIKTEVIYKERYDIVKEVEVVAGTKKVLKNMTIDDFIKQIESNTNNGR